MSAKKTEEAKGLSVEQIEAKIDQIQSRILDLDSEQSKLSSEASTLRKEVEDLRVERTRRLTPYKVGDIVVDDLGVKYRVHEVVMARRWNRKTGTEFEPGETYGIRLTKSGNEAYARSRIIRSTEPLTKYEPESE